MTELEAEAVALMLGTCEDPPEVEVEELNQSQGEMRRKMG